MARKPECSKCGKPKENPRNSYCKSCKNGISSSHYAANKPRYRAWNKQARSRHYDANKEQYREWNRAKRARVREAVNHLKSVPCPDCGNKYHPWQMTFDHLPGTRKLFNISDARGLKPTLEEIKKCEAVCFNCHADRTYRRMKADTAREPFIREAS